MPRKPFLLRLDPALLEALQRWANDEVRSLNGQIEFLLTTALRDAGRGKVPGERPARTNRREGARTPGMVKRKTENGE